MYYRHIIAPTLHTSIRKWHVFIHGFYIRWLLISLCARMIKNRSFPKKNLHFRCDQMPSTNRNSWFTPYARIVRWATILYKNHGFSSGIKDGLYMQKLIYLINVLLVYTTGIPNQIHNTGWPKVTANLYCNFAHP